MVHDLSNCFKFDPQFFFLRGNSLLDVSGVSSIYFEGDSFQYLANIFYLVVQPYD